MYLQYNSVWCGVCERSVGVDYSAVGEEGCWREREKERRLPRVRSHEDIVGILDDYFILFYSNLFYHSHISHLYLNNLYYLFFSSFMGLISSVLRRKAVKRLEGRKKEKKGIKKELK